MENISSTLVDSLNNSVIIIVDNKVVDNRELSWHSSEYTSELSLQEISEQINTTGVIYVWVDTPLRGMIYQYNNYNDSLWYEHGHTKGFA